MIVRETRLLVIRRSQFVRAPRSFCFPGGGIEDSETEDEALTRELEEELSVAVNPVRRLWRSTTPWKVDLAWWLTHLDADETIVPCQEEVESIHWLSPSEIRDLPDLLESNREFLDAWDRGEFRI